MPGWKTELCSVQPKELEQVNRGQFIQRRGIRPYEREGADGEAERGWECECRIVTAEEYRTLKAQEEIIENQLTLMSAVAEVYETQNGGE